jgi:hypothetical protein
MPPLYNFATTVTRRVENDILSASRMSRFAKPNAYTRTVLFEKLKPSSLKRMLQLCPGLLRNIGPKATLDTFDSR